MVKIVSVTLATIAAYGTFVDAHSSMTVPKPTYDQGFYQYMNPVMRIDGNKFAKNIPGYKGIEKITAAMQGQSSLKSFIMANAVLPGGGSKECGWGKVNGEPQPLPDAVEFTWAHPGPCEVWCDNTKVFYNINCMGNNVGKVPLNGKCNGAKMVQAMYIGTHVENWEVYMSCAPIGSGGSGGNNNNNNNNNNNRGNNNNNNNRGNNNNNNNRGNNGQNNNNNGNRNNNNNNNGNRSFDFGSINRQGNNNGRNNRQLRA